MSSEEAHVVKTQYPYCIVVAWGKRWGCGRTPVSCPQHPPQEPWIECSVVHALLAFIWRTQVILTIVVISTWAWPRDQRTYFFPSRSPYWLKATWFFISLVLQPEHWWMAGCVLSKLDCLSSMHLLTPLVSWRAFLQLLLWNIESFGCCANCASRGPRCWSLADRDFKAVILNLFKELALPWMVCLSR